MKRLAEDHLKKWISQKNRKPLMIRGARQVGKTTLVRNFCNANNIDLIYLNIEKNPIKCIETSYDVEAFIREVRILSGKNFANNSLLFLDEIQSSPKCIVMLRYLYEEKPELPIITAGSLLEFILNDFPYSIPVGRIEYYHLSPMTFTEFLLAKNEPLLIEELERTPLTGSIFEKADKLFREYLFVGGMPEAINKYIETQDFQEVRKIHKDIIYTYKEDINKYTKGKQSIKTSVVLEKACNVIGKKFKFNQIEPTFPSRDIKKSIELLSLARVLLPCFHTNAGGMPIKSQIDHNIYKLFYIDVGLFNTEMDTSWKQLSELNGDDLLIKGTICEQFIAQHLAYINQGIDPPQLFYWLRDKASHKAEVDFVISSNENILPIEIKSGAAGHLKSLSSFMYEKEYKTALRFDLKQRNHFITKVSTPLFSGDTKMASEYMLLNFSLFQIEFLSKILKNYFEKN